MPFSRFKNSFSSNFLTATLLRSRIGAAAAALLPAWRNAGKAFNFDTPALNFFFASDGSGDAGVVAAAACTFFSGALKLK